MNSRADKHWMLLLGRVHWIQQKKTAIFNVFDVSLFCVQWKAPVRNPLVSTLMEPLDPIDDSSAHWIDKTGNMQLVGSNTKSRYFMPDVSERVAWMSFPSRSFVRLNHLRTGVRRFSLNMHTGGLAPLVPCECSLQKRSPGLIVLECPKHRPLNGAYGLAVLDDETTKFLLNALLEV